MTIQYSENSSEETEILLNESQNNLSLKGLVTNDIYLEIAFPFRLTKIHPQYKVLTNPIEDILVFRNNYFSEYDICEVRHENGDVSGLLFKPSIIFDDDARYLYKDNKILQVAIFRSIVNLMAGNLSLKPDTIKERRELGYRFEDYLPNDVIFGVFPFEWNGNSKKKTNTEILSNLYLNGFYFLNKSKDSSFIPPQISFQEKNFNSLITNKFFYKPLKIISQCDKVKTNRYYHHYLKEVTKENNNYIAKFHQVYGLIEIFKDEILKREIAEKICANRINSTATGHKIQQEVMEMSRDLYNIGKLFTKYRDTTNETLEAMLWDIYIFLDSHRDPNEIKDILVFSQAYYYLRNIVVHDIQFLFMGEPQEISIRTADFEKIALGLEYLVIETLCYLKI